MAEADTIFCDKNQHNFPKLVRNALKRSDNLLSSESGEHRNMTNLAE